MTIVEVHIITCQNVFPKNNTILVKSCLILYIGVFQLYETAITIATLHVFL